MLLFIVKQNILDTHMSRKTTSKAFIHLGYWLLTYIIPRGLYKRLLNWQPSFGLWTCVITGSWINEPGDLASPMEYLPLALILWASLSSSIKWGFLTERGFMTNINPSQELLHEPSNKMWIRPYGDLFNLISCWFRYDLIWTQFHYWKPEKLKIWSLKILSAMTF